jgi:LysM repeat protein
MGAKFVAAIIGVIILVVLAQTFVFGGDDNSPSVNNPSSIPTATPPAEQNDPVLLGEGDAGGGSSSAGSSSSSSRTTYTVQSGDTLGGIASAQGVAPEDQAAWIQEVLDLNDMEDARQLQAGQELILPGAPQSSASLSATESTDDDAEADEPEATPPPSATGTLPTATPSNGGGGSAGTYTVVDGDTPYGIALNHCVEDPDAWVNELLEINAVDANSLSVGMELDLPPGTPAFCGEEGTGEDTPEEATPEEDGG